MSTSLAIHPVSGDVYVGGYTNSTATPTFPGVSGGAQATPGGGNYDGLLSRFNANLTVPHKSTYLGSVDSDLLYTLAIHPLSGETMRPGPRPSAG
ncbi:MAG: hypothetical protein IPO58_27020 [Betaproteobacteria bacterium]|nr:hypothetical protein [Betaproteobacteria bacterium]